MWCYVRLINLVDRNSGRMSKKDIKITAKLN